MPVFRRCVVAIAAIAALSGQSAPAPAPPKPLRHLEYSFAADYQFTGEGHSTGLSAGGMGSNGSGVRSLLGSRGRVGTVDVDVIGFADDGALAFTAAEWIRNEPRARASLTCEARDSGEVRCDGPYPVTDVEGVLLLALARGFVDDSLIDAQGRWSRSYATAHVKVTGTYALTDPGNGRPVKISLHREIVSTDGTGANWHEQADMTYDRALKDPVQLHEVVDEVPRGGSVEHATFDLALTKDSFAAH